VAGGFFTKIQKTRPPDIISSINWVTATSESVYEKVTETPSLRGLWHRWDLPPLPVGEDPVYALAGDFSDGVPDGDLTLLGVARVNDARLCAAARFRAYPEDIADEMARAVAFFGQERTWVAGELNNVGKAVLVAWRKYGHGLNYTQERKTRAYIDDTEMMWFLQTVSTRTPALLAFREAYQKDKLLIPDERFEWDAEGFIKHENGKYAAMESKSERTGEKYRDDYVMMGAILNELITWLKSRGVGVMDSTSIIITPQDDTMIKQMSGPMQKILRRHMEVRR